MLHISIENTSISLNEIQECLDKIKGSFDNGDFQIKIEASKKIDSIDPLLIGYLTVLKANNRGSHIELSLPQNDLKNDNDLGYQLYQHIANTYVITGILLKIHYGDELLDPIKNNRFGKNSIAASERIFPILFIGSEFNFLEFDFLFSHSLGELLKLHGQEALKTLPDRRMFKINNDGMKAGYNRFFVSRCKVGERKITMLNLSRMYFVNALHSAKITPLYFQGQCDLDTGQALQVGNLSLSDSRDFYQSIKYIFDELENSPIINQIVFSTLLGTEMLEDSKGFKRITKENMAEFGNKVESIWNYSESTCKGLKELAKNIIEHSKDSTGESSRPGGISIRTFSKNSWENLRRNDSNYGKLLESMNANVESILDINVFDTGEQGIMGKLTSDTKEAMSFLTDDSVFKRSMEEDYNRIVEGEIGLIDLIRTDSVPLNFQSKRSIAHFGLMVLSKLVENNKGLVIVSTFDRNENSKRETASNPILTDNLEYGIKTGTIFNITLPIRSDVVINSSGSALSIPNETNADDIQGIEDLLGYHVVLMYGNDPIPETGNLLLVSRFLDTTLKNREDEERFFLNFWGRLNQIADLIEGRNFAIVIDFETVSMDESRLFRFFGKVELNFPDVSFIVMGIPNKTFQKLCDLNLLFVQNSNGKLAFWNETSATLVYSTLDTDNGPFYFTDVLWGKTFDDFVCINKIASQVTFNTTSLLQKDEDKGQNLEHVQTGPSILFHNHAIPFPFELMLQDRSGMSLFERNVTILLQNNLISDQI